MAVGMASALVAIITAWRFGYRDAAFIYAAGGIFLLLYVGGLFVGGVVIPPRLEQVRGKAIGEAMSFHLTDKAESDKRSNP